MLRISALVVSLALIAGLSPCEAGAAASDRPLVQPGTPLRVMLLPVKLPKEQAPSRRRLQRTLRGLAAWATRASYGRLRIEGEIAPIFVAPSRKAVPSFGSTDRALI